MIASTRTVAALGSALVLLGTGACGSEDERAIPTMVVAWPQESDGREAGGTETRGGTPAEGPSTPDASAAPRPGGQVVALADAVDVEALDAARTDTVEDRSAVADLLDAVGLGEDGSCTVSVETAPQVVLVVSCTPAEDGEPVVDGEVWPEVVEDRGTLLLATIADLDAIVFEGPGDGAAAIDRMRADALAREPVAELGATTTGLRELVDALEGPDAGR